MAKSFTFIVMRRFNHKKAVQALNLFAVRGGGSMNKMKALKLMWLADRFHLRKYGRTIIFDFYVAMENGPVPSLTRDILQQNAMGASNEALEYSNKYLRTTQYDYSSVANTNEGVFSSSDLEALGVVFDTYGGLGKYELRDLTHEFPEWKKWEDGIKNKKFKSHEMDYNDFFLSAGDNHALFTDDAETLGLVQALFSKQK